MTFKELLDNPPPSDNMVTFVQEPFEDGYVEAGMKGKILSVQWTSDNCVKIVFDLDPFRLHNKELESPNYYDSNGNPCLTATQKGNVPNTDNYYFDLDDNVEDFFTLSTSKLWDKYISDVDSKSTMSYTAWLEKQLTESMHSTDSTCKKAEAWDIAYPAITFLIEAENLSPSGLEDVRRAIKHYLLKI